MLGGRAGHPSTTFSAKDPREHTGAPCCVVRLLSVAVGTPQGKTAPRRRFHEIVDALNESSKIRSYSDLRTGRPQVAIRTDF